MKKLLLVILLLVPFVSFSQEWIDDSNFEDKINHKEAFGDDENVIVVVEFWAKFNEINAFPDFDKIEGAKYYRVDIAKAPAAKKEHRVRMAPTLIIFSNGVKETSFKAGLDLECPVSLEELQEAIEDAKQADIF
tara:strand:+ start:2536 stop:2937 length:402 start_codon:yes stop_codon:yes gene_type:complete